MEIGLTNCFSEVLHSFGGAVRRFTDHRQLAERLAGGTLGALVFRGEAQLAQVLGDAADGGRIRAAVVVEDDDQLGLALPDVVQRLVRHPAGERTVADDTDHLATLTAQLPCGGKGERVAQARRGM